MMHQRSFSHSNIKFQWVILLVGVLLFCIKFLAFFITNSVGILSDALESIVNIITGMITLLSLKFAAIPRDENHPYGHGKIELVTASLEGFLIALAGGIVIFEAIQRLGNPIEVIKMDIGLGLILLTIIGNGLLGWISIKWGRKNRSVAIETGGKHLLTDSFSSVALLVGLIIFYLTKITWLDSAIAIIFGLFIIYTGIKVLISTVNGLLDEADPIILSKISDVLMSERRNSWVNIHRLTYLGYGHIGHVDLHLTLPFYFNLQEAESEIQTLKNITKSDLSEFDLDISIQSEPCVFEMCSMCNMENCTHRKTLREPSKQWSYASLVSNNAFKTKSAKTNASQ